MLVIYIIKFKMQTCFWVLQVYGQLVLIFLRLCKSHLWGNRFVSKATNAPFYLLDTKINLECYLGCEITWKHLKVRKYQIYSCLCNINSVPLCLCTVFLIRRGFLDVVMWRLYSGPYQRGTWVRLYGHLAFLNLSAQFCNLNNLSFI